MNDEHRQNLQNYIRDQLGAGQSPDTVHAQVLAAGWPADEVEKAFIAVQASMLPTTMQPKGSGIVPQAAGRKRGRIATGWALFKASLSILNGNRYLLRYLVMTGVWVFGITAAFVTIYIVFDRTMHQNSYDDSLRLIGYLFAFLDYLSIYFFINLYAAGLTANVFDIFKGQHKSYPEYMRIAWSKAPAILTFSLIQSIVGMILQYIVERIRFVGWILSWILGTLWSLGTLFVIPIIVNDEKPSGVRSIKDSVSFFKKTWGENIVAKVSVNVPLGLIQIALFAGFIALVIPVVISGVAVLFWVLLFAYLIATLTISIVGSFANSLVNIALYFFATQHEVPPAFSADILNQVFVQRNKGRWFGKKNPQPAA